MSIEHITRQGYRLLEGLETGHLSGADAYNIATDLDPVLLCIVFRYLRERYGADPQGQGVLQRLLELSKTYPALVQQAKAAESDVVVEWFDDTYSVKDFYSDPEELVRMVVDKLES